MADCYNELAAAGLAAALLHSGSAVMPPTFRQLSSTAKMVVLAINPKAGVGNGLARAAAVVAKLQAEGLSVEIVTELDAAVSRSTQLHAAGALRALIAAGGDGTATELVNRTAAGLPIALLPLGTENLLAKHLCLMTGPDGVARAICEGYVADLDAGQAGDRVFLLHVGIGFDAEVVRRLAEGRRGPIRHWSYAKPIFDAIRSYQYPPLKVYCHDSRETKCDEVRWAFVFNLPVYARGLNFAPAAGAVDGLLDVCTFRHGRLWHGLRYLAHVLQGSHRTADDCTLFQTSALRIESAAEAWYQVDGDPAGKLPVEIRVLRQRLSLIAPRAWFETAGMTPKVVHAGL